MKTKIVVLGSCISRDPFNSQIVHNYKDFFKIEVDGHRTSIISIMQDSILFDEESIEILPLNIFNKAGTRYISEDLNKTFIKDLIEKEIDYLIIDTFIEVKMGILYFNKQIIINNCWDLPKTKFYNDMTDKLIVDNFNYPKEYFCIWSDIMTYSLNF